MTDLALGTLPSALPVAGPKAATPAPGAVSADGKPAPDGATEAFAALLSSLAPGTDAPAAAAPAAPAPGAMILAGVPQPTRLAGAPAPDAELPETAEREADDSAEPQTDGDAETDDAEDPQLALMLSMIPLPTATPTPIRATVTPAATEGSIAPLALSRAPIAAAPIVADQPKGPDGSTEGSTEAVPKQSTPQSPPEPLPASRFASLAVRLLASAAPAATTQATETSANPTAATPPAAGTTPAHTVSGQTATASTVAAPATTADQPLPMPPATPEAVAQQAAISPSALPQHGLPRGRPITSHESLSLKAAAIDASPTDKPTVGPNGIPTFVPTATAPASADPAATAVPNGTAPADATVTRELAVARDDKWLDTLARDIAATAGKDGQLSFRLDPHHLGSLTVHITHADDGASIRLSADTEAGRQMLQDAQPRLAVEARAQGLTLRDSSVDLGGSNTGQSGQQQGASSFSNLAQGQSQRDSGRDHPFINLVAGEGDEPARTPEAGARSDLYA